MSLFLIFARQHTAMEGYSYIRQACEKDLCSAAVCRFPFAFFSIFHSKATYTSIRVTNNMNGQTFGFVVRLVFIVAVAVAIFLLICIRLAATSSRDVAPVTLVITAISVAPDIDV